jgi:anti-sigma factor RsiW
MTQGGNQTGDGGAQRPQGEFAPTPLDRYLDAMMDPAEAAAFEASLADNESLRREVELQRRINEALKVRFAPPAEIDVPARAAAPRRRGIVASITGAGSARAGKSGMRRLGTLAAAAGVVLLAGAGAAYWWLAIGTEAPFRQPAQIYQAQAAAGFIPEWVCTTDDEFVQTLRDRFGTAALLPMSTPGVQIVGWAYNTPVLSNKTATLMTRVDGADVLVLIDTAERDVNLRRAGDAGQARDLHLFKRRLGDLVLYEVTPLDEPRVIPEFVPAG